MSELQCTLFKVCFFISIRNQIFQKAIIRIHRFTNFYYKKRNILSNLT